MEDDVDDQLLIRDALADIGFTGDIIFAGNGLEMLNMLADDPGLHKRVDIVLMDLNMPILDGRSTLQHLSSIPSLRSMPVIIFTTSSFDEDVRASYELGARSYITKPRSYKRLVEVVGSVRSYWFDTAVRPRLVGP